MKRFNPEALAALRKERGISLAEMASATDNRVTRQALWLWETGQQAPSLSSLLILVDAFNVPMDYFFIDDDYHGNNDNRTVGCEKVDAPNG